jgi:hypothetical protein
MDFNLNCRDAKTQQYYLKEYCMVIIENLKQHV